VKENAMATVFELGRARNGEGESRLAELAELFASGDPPAFAADASHRITLFNRGAERVLGVKASEVLGRPCYEVLAGRDLFGNRYCYERCPVHATLKKGESPLAFDIQRESKGGEKRTLSVTTLTLRGGSPNAFTLVHILRPCDERQGVLRLLRDLGVNVPQDGTAPTAEGCSSPAEASTPPLTPRETEILQLVAQGLQNKEVAQRLELSVATVRNHIHNILDKLGVHSKLEAVSLAFRSGWVRE
jgi:DNA-binding CsgD family transcriptional regulator